MLLLSIVQVAKAQRLHSQAWHCFRTPLFLHQDQPGLLCFQVGPCQAGGCQVGGGDWAALLPWYTASLEAPSTDVSWPARLWPSLCTPGLPLAIQSYGCGRVIARHLLPRSSSVKLWPQEPPARGLLKTLLVTRLRPPAQSPSALCDAKCSTWQQAAAVGLSYKTTTHLAKGR